MNKQFYYLAGGFAMSVIHNGSVCDVAFLEENAEYAAEGDPGFYWFCETPEVLKPIFSKLGITSLQNVPINTIDAIIKALS